MKGGRWVLGIRAQLLLVLVVFLALPWLGYEYVRELERFLREGQEQTLAGTAQAIATALHDRPALFEHRSTESPTLSTLPAARNEAERQEESPSPSGDATANTMPLPPQAAVHGTPIFSADIEQIIRGLSRTTARIWVIDKNLNVLARAGSLKQPPKQTAQPEASVALNLWRSLERSVMHPLYSLFLKQPAEDLEEQSRRALPADKDIDGALTGIMTIGRRPTAEGKATIVSAAHPIWVRDEVKGAVVVEATTNAVLAERNLAFERLFNIVVATLLIGSITLFAFASRLSSRIRRLAREADAAIDARGRVREALPSSSAGDEIGDLSRSFSDVLNRLSQYAQYQETMAARLSHELKTPIAVVRSSLENLDAASLPHESAIYIERAKTGLERLNHVLRRMTEASRLEQMLQDVERERFDLNALVRSCVEGYRAVYPRQRLELQQSNEDIYIDGAPEMMAQLLDKLVDNAVEFSSPDSPVIISLARKLSEVELSVSNSGPVLPSTMAGRLFDSMVSVRSQPGGDVPHLGLGLYIARLIATFHGGTIRAENRPDGGGVIVTVDLPAAM